MNVSDFIVKRLAEWDVKRVFGDPALFTLAVALVPFLAALAALTWACEPVASGR